MNIDHTPKMRGFLNELLEKHKTRIIKDSLCINCHSDANEEFTRYIFWHKYTFCSYWCQYDTEYDIRKSYRRSVKKN